VLNQGAFSMIGGLKLSTLAGAAYLSGKSGLVTGRLDRE
jgi:hypothetical protein